MRIHGLAIVLLIGCHNSNPGAPPDAPGGSDAAVAIDAVPLPDAAPAVDHLKQIDLAYFISIARVGITFLAALAGVQK